jgi:hypothetical protein
MQQKSASFDESSQTHPLLFLIAFSLINIVVFTLLLCSVGFLFGASVGKWQFPLAMLLALVVTYFAGMGFLGIGFGLAFLKTVISVLVSVLTCIIVAGFFYDVSFDGQWYHQETVYRLKQGYNPVRQIIPTPPDELFGNSYTSCVGVDAKNIKPLARPTENLKFININNFSKGSEVVEAAIYSLTNRIETGKALNGILLIAGFLLGLFVLHQLPGLNIGYKWLLAGILAFNPIAITQLFSFCVDGNLACILLLLLALGVLLFINPKGIYLFMFAGVLSLVITVKFTGFVFAGIFCFGLLVILLAFKKRQALIKAGLAGAIATIIAVFCMGFNPYITNITQKHDPFYGLQQTRDELANITPPLFKPLNRVQKFFFSITAHQGWHSADKPSLSHVPKIPFTLNKEDIREAADAQQPFSGFGPFFSGILFITLAMFVLPLFIVNKKQPFKLCAGICLTIACSVLIVPDAWWARFVPQFWLVPLMVVLTSYFVYFRGVIWLRRLIYFALILNIAWAVFGIGFNVLNNARINYQMLQLKALNKPVYVEYCSYKAFKSNQIRFNEWGIITLPGPVSGADVYNITESGTRYQTQTPLPQLPKPFLLKLAYRVSGK